MSTVKGVVFFSPGKDTKPFTHSSSISAVFFLSGPGKKKYSPKNYDYLGLGR